MEINKPVIKKVVAAVGGLTLGFVGGYSIGRYRARKEFLLNLDEEINRILEEESAKTIRPSRSFSSDDKPPIGEILPDAEEGATPVFDKIITEYGGHTLDELRQEQPVVPVEDLQALQEHFANGAIPPRNPEPEPEPEPELREIDRSIRTLTSPYVISIDEYHEDEDEGMDKVTVTYYTGGDDGGILAREDGSVIDDVDYAIGEDSLQQFGVGSQDPNIVYVRNHQVGCDYEVVRSKRSYNEAVHGIPEMPEPPMRSMRVGDGD